MIKMAMLQFVLSQDQLKRIQNQIQLISRINEAKVSRLKALEQNKALTTTSRDAADYIKMIDTLKQENTKQENIIKKLVAEMKSEKSNHEKIKELELLLEEERKVRQFSEQLTEQMEIRCAEEALIKDLTSELCQLQKNEVAVSRKQMQQLQHLIKSADESGHVRLISQNHKSKGSMIWNKKLRFIIGQLKTKLLQFEKDFKQSSAALTTEDQKHLKNLNVWLKEIELMNAEVTEIENLRHNLRQLKNEIDNLKKLI